MLRRVSLRPIALVAISLLAGGGAWTGCNPFSSGDEPRVEVDAGPPVADAGAPDADDCVAPACEDFDSPDWAKGWEAVGALSTATTDSVSPPASLEARLTAPAEESYLRYQGRARHILVSFKVKVVEAGEGEVELFRLSDSPLSKPAVLPFRLVRSVGNRKYGLEVPGGGKHNFVATFEGWTAVSLELDFVRQRYGYEIGGETNGSGKEQIAGLDPVNVHISLGLRSLVAATGWVVRYDDLRITVLSAD